jgi:hypothetical protein
MSGRLSNQQKAERNDCGERKVVGVLRENRKQDRRGYIMKAGNLEAEKGG